MLSPTPSFIRLRLTIKKISLKVRFSCYVMCAIKVGKFLNSKMKKNMISLEKVNLKMDSLY